MRNAIGPEAVMIDPSIEGQIRAALNASALLDMDIVVRKTKNGYCIISAKNLWKLDTSLILQSEHLDFLALYKVNIIEVKEGL